MAVDSLPLLTTRRYSSGTVSACALNVTAGCAHHTGGGRQNKLSQDTRTHCILKLCPAACNVSSTGCRCSDHHPSG